MKRKTTRLKHKRLPLASFVSAAVLGIGLGSVAVPGIAANSWLSRSVEIEPSGTAKVSLPTNRGKTSPVTIFAKGGDSTRTVFDITVSLYNSPAGDDDPTTGSGEEQAKYEDVMRYFADAVCEQTNGSHHLGKVRLFTNRNQQAAADIVWTQSKWPQAHIAGFGANGRHIFFGDTFPNGNGNGSDRDMLADPEGSGYTLGHEWGHYTYGLFDEYRGNNPAETRSGTPQTSDVPTVPSIMHSQWNAAGGNYEWLNYSTANNIGNTARTAQGRVYGKSAWEVLVQQTSEDPKSGDLKAQPDRVHYSSLDVVAPEAADNWVKEELPGDQADCRSDLEIIWVVGDIELQVVLDRSGSMSGSAISNAKLAASRLVDVTADGKTALGVASFSTSLTQNAAIQAIPDPGAAVKAAIKNEIASLGASGGTRLYDGAIFALDQLMAYQMNLGTTAPQVVFLLSDGRDTSSSQRESDVIAQYQAKNVPIFTFGFGGAAPTGTLLRMANETGGQFFPSPNTLQEIIDAFLQANAAASNVQNLIGEHRSLVASSVESFTVPLDSGLDSVTLILTHSGNANDVLARVIDPLGNDVGVGVLSCSQGSSGTSCFVEIDDTILSAGGAGDWEIVIENAVATDLEIDLNLTASPNDSGAVSVRVAGFEGNKVSYPDPIILTTSVIKDLPITGVNVSAMITDPFGAQTLFDMVDDGTAGDAEAGDGIYSAILGYSENGTYNVEVRVDNNAGTASFTTEGLLPSHPSPDVNGNMPIAPVPPAITDNFVRVSKTSIVVENVPRGDPNDGPATAVELVPDNSSVDSRIDFADDEDYFVIRNIDTTAELAVRISSLSLGMDPTLTILADDQQTELVTAATLPANASGTGYLYVRLAPGTFTETIYAVVRHVDATATTGGYKVSAGEPINTDVPPNEAPVAGDDVNSVVEGENVQIAVLANDTDADGDPLTVESVDTSGVQGAVTLNGDGTVDYVTDAKPFNLAPGDTFSEAFSYTLTDSKAFSTGLVTITVTGNTPPVAVADTARVVANATTTISVLANDSDVDGQALSITSVDDSALSGTVADNGNGVLTYNPSGAFNHLSSGQTGTDTFSYTVSDTGGLSSTANVTVTVTPVPSGGGGGGGGGGAAGMAALFLLLSLCAVRRSCNG